MGMRHSLSLKRSGEIDALNSRGVQQQAHQGAVLKPALPSRLLMAPAFGLEA